MTDDQKDDTLVRWSSRKFWTMMFWQSVITGLMAVGRLPVDTFESLTYLILGGYFLSNVIGKRVSSK